MERDFDFPVQVNLSIPSSWKAKLIEMSDSRYKPDGRKVSYQDMIREAIAGHYGFQTKDGRTLGKT